MPSKIGFLAGIRPVRMPSIRGPRTTLVFKRRWSSSRAWRLVTHYGRSMSQFFAIFYSNAHIVTLASLLWPQPGDLRSPRRRQNPRPFNHRFPCVDWRTIAALRPRLRTGGYLSPRPPVLWRRHCGSRPIIELFLSGSRPRSSSESANQSDHYARGWLNSGGGSVCAWATSVPPWPSGVATKLAAM